MAGINPYLTFNGNTEEVFNFYKSIFGGDFAAVMHYGDAPSCDEMPIAESDKDKIMHIALPIGGNVLMASDAIKSMGQKLTEADNFSISINTDTKEEADKIFGGLADGGKVEMPLADAFWGDYFGMLRDRFGIQWMVNYNEKYVQN
jgi:PhnB protein